MQNDKTPETNEERIERERIEFGALGDIRVPPDRVTSPGDPTKRAHFKDDDLEKDEPMDGGSGHDASHHPGSREMTEGTTGGAGTEVGGTRNFRQGAGFTSGDIGNRPE